MKHMSINPVTIVREHLKELRNQYRATDDPQQKDILLKRLRNLHNVLQFLSRAQNGTPNVGNYA
ncbi:MAG TPA: hypothetical protein DEQ59_13940 [Geobacter sulfurreducens]|nr:hypothetical protein RW64_03025 [Geobacter sulfurreducens]HCD97439.1 hypothetical protein [Geobacter sulfurreducens]